MSNSLTPRLLLLSAIALLLFEYPLLSLADKNALLGELPLLYVYSFSVWLLLIVLTALLIRRKKDRIP
ncbi:MAG: hypothetical protein J0L99_18930 [Chitinophagales bacterium]|nr:hypothetical protein [Chitinophagales bacterium]